METDPIKRSLDAIEQELESALSNLNATNQRVDDLLNEYATGEISVPRPAVDEAPAEAEDDSDEPAPEY